MSIDSQIHQNSPLPVSEEMLVDTAVMRLSILGALKLYLDFINLFLFLLRLLGRRS